MQRVLSCCRDLGVGATLYEATGWDGVDPQFDGRNIAGDTGFAAVQQTTLGFLLSRNQIDLRIATTSAQNSLSAQLSTLDTLPVADFLPTVTTGCIAVKHMLRRHCGCNSQRGRSVAAVSNLCAYGQCSARLCSVELLRYQPRITTVRFV